MGWKHLFFMMHRSIWSYEILMLIVNLGLKNTAAEVVIFPTTNRCTALCGSGWITSPGYPDNYHHFIDLCWAIMGDVITIEFTDFAVENHRTCRYDNINITDADSTQLYCGSNRPPSGPYRELLYVIFHTDYNRAYRGFNMTYSIDDACGSRVHNPELITSSSYCNYTPVNFTSMNSGAGHGGAVVCAEWCELDTNNVCMSSYYDSCSTCQQCSLFKLNSLYEGLDEVDGLVERVVIQEPEIQSNIAATTDAVLLTDRVLDTTITISSTELLYWIFTFKLIMVQHQELYVYIYGSENLCDNPADTDINVYVVKLSSRCPTDKHFELCSFDSVQGAAPRTHCRYVCECQPDCSDMMVSLSGKQRATSYVIREAHWQPKQDVDTGNTCTHSQAGWLEDRVVTLGDD